MRRAVLVAVLAAVAWLAGTEGAKAVPFVDYSCSPAPADCSGWYTTDVTLRWFPSSDVLSTEGCEWVRLAEEAAHSRRCTVSTDLDSVSRTVIVHIDKTPPQVVSATPSRPPDANGWYNRPVSVTFVGADATSGVASCTTASYGGPDAGSAALLGTCRDQAGLVSPPGAFALNFDATPPALARVRALGGDGKVDVRWRTGSDARTVEVVRTPGVSSAARSVVFRGRGSHFEDERVRNGARYSYVVRSADAAGNVIGRAAVAVAGPQLRSPAAGTRARAGRPLTLAWSPVRGARYYNVQLFRGSRKVLTAWPTRARYRLRRSWTFDGRRVRLSPGRYRWYVWPGYGARGERRFGRLVGRRTFVVRR